MYIYIYIYLFIYLFVCLFVYLFVCLIYFLIYTYIYIYIHTYMHTYIYRCVCGSASSMGLLPPHVVQGGHQKVKTCCCGHSFLDQFHGSASSSFVRRGS